ncbi:recombinase RecT [Planctomicrobium sp. SH668]|uniref:recombinase RecT n=1 Tax=Planctomicrobium sp. SH668 TaxID=3448126 RepID=UPI003F5B3423
MVHANTSNGKRGATLPKEPEAAPVNGITVMANKKETLNRRMSAFESILSDQRTKLINSLPKSCGLTVERLTRLVLSSFRDNPDLLNCTPESIFASIGEAAQLGLQIDGTLGHAYLVPYKSECKLMPGYKGLLDLVRRHDKINIKTRCVYKGDQFHYEEGDEDRIVHIPDQSGEGDCEDSDVTHVYLIAKDMETGAVICRNVWSRKRIESHKRKYSKAWKKDDNAWNTAWSSMARKTLIRDSINRGELPVAVEVLRLAGREEQFEARYVTIEEPKRLTIDGIGSRFDDAVRPYQRPTADVESDSEDSAIEPNPGVDHQDVPEDHESDNETIPDVEIVEDDPLSLREGETPKKWELRILDAIKDVKGIDQLANIEDAIYFTGEQGLVSAEMAHRLSLRVGERRKNFR